MRLAEMMLPEFDDEMAGTRKTIERVPEDKLGWKPHEKSMSMGVLATHLANLPTWMTRAIESDSFDLAPPGAPPARVSPVGSRAEALDRFDRNVSEARAALADASDDHLLKNWTLLSGGKAVMTLTRFTVLRRFALNHSIHHRAQLCVYLRLNDVPVPPLYGPSADEGSI